MLDDGTPFYLIICMYPSMAKHLMASKFLSIDTSFKRIHDKWQEFEIEAWDDVNMRCMESIIILYGLLISVLIAVVSVRAFTTSQSAQAHYILFTRIFHFAALDTGLLPKFAHIHGEGFHLFIADAHKGQAQGK